MADFTRVGIKEFYIGASTDDKPASAPPGSQAYEHNTGALFIMAPDMSTWTAYAPKKFIADGTVAAPGLAFASDPDTGIYRVGANTLGITAGGAQAMNLTTVAGRPAVGIGTAGVEWAGLLTEISRTNIGESVPVAIEGHYKLAVTDAPWAYNFSSVDGTSTILATNTQNWTKTSPSIIGVWGGVQSLAGATGTISWAAPVSAYFEDVENIKGVTVTNFCNFFAGDPRTANGGAVTNLYGLYVKALTSGATSNYAVYSESNGIRIGGTSLFTSAADISLTVQGTGSSNVAKLILDRVAEANYAAFTLATGGTEKWYMGLWTGSANLIIRDGVNNKTFLSITPGATGVATWADVTHTGLNITSGQVLSVGGTQVVGARQVDARINDTPNSGDVTTDGIIAALQACVQTHGLMTAS